MAERKKSSLGTRILYGVLAGVGVGVLLGEWAGPFGVVGRIYVGLLQMTVLPYVTVSLVTKIGGLTMEDARRIGGQAGLVMVLLWIVSLAVVLVMPFSLPAWEAGTFYSSSLVDRPPPIDFLDLYLPTNPFHSLANNLVPAAVLFSILIGIALIAVPKKRRLLDDAEVVSDALGRISNWVVLMAPYGTFALTAHSAGVLAPQELLRLSGYVSTNTLGALFLTFVGLPALVAALSPFSVRGILKGFKSAGLTAFATGKLFAVLQMVIESAKEQLKAEGIEEDEADAMANVYVPLGYPFPNAGKILALLFIPFAAWFAGRPLSLGDYPALLSVGLLSFFGSPVAAIPFLLDMLRLPQDVFPLFLVAGIWAARFGDLLGAMHLTAFTLLTSAWNKGWLRPNPAKLLVGTGVAGGILLLFAAANHFVVKAAMANQAPSQALVESLDLMDDLVEIRVEDEAGPNPEPYREGESAGDRARRTKTLRAGYVPKRPPFCYRNAKGKLVGFDIDLVQRLASDMRLDTVVLIPCAPADLAKAFAADCFDVAVGGLELSLDAFDAYRMTTPYLELHVALLVPDYDARRFRDFGGLIENEHVTLGYLKDSYLVRTNRHRLPYVELKALPSFAAYVEGKVTGVDALLTTAETGSYLAMIHPEFSLVVPESAQARVPVSMAGTLKALRGERFLDTWIKLKRHDGTIDLIYDHWILGKHAKRKPRRWSVVQDVLGWGD